jgi:hypothetical protein
MKKLIDTIQTENELNIIQDKKEKILISFSGGKTSAYMAYFLLNEWEDRDKYEFLCVFANTGKELEETLEFVNKCDIEFNLNLIWVESLISNTYGQGIKHKIVDYNNCSRNGEPFEAIISKYGIPSQGMPFCSDYLKKSPIRSFASSIGWDDYTTAIGIRIDEPKRLKKKSFRVLYPLAQLKYMTKQNINAWWEKQSFNLNIKSYQGNCDLCWKKSNRTLMTLLDEKPNLVDWWLLMEDKYKDFVSEGKQGNVKYEPPYYFLRGQVSYNEIIEESKFPFRKEIDKNIQSNDLEQLRLWNYELDSTDGCTESCEVF